MALHCCDGSILGFFLFQILLYHKGVNIDAQDRNGMTPLILASKDCAVTMAKQLLDRQAEPGIADHKGNRWLETINSSGGDTMVVIRVVELILIFLQARQHYIGLLLLIMLMVYDCCFTVMPTRMYKTTEYGHYLY